LRTAGTQAYRARECARTRNAADGARASATIEGARIDARTTDPAKIDGAAAGFATIGRVATKVRFPVFRIDS
jgi:hypothetical protein